MSHPNLSIVSSFVVVLLALNVTGCTESIVQPAEPITSRPVTPSTGDQPDTGIEVDTVVPQDFFQEDEYGSDAEILLDAGGADMGIEDTPKESDILTELPLLDALIPADTSEPFDTQSIEEIWAQPPGDVACLEEKGLKLYAELIEPILVAEESQSCNQCHLSGMNLSMYAQGTPCDTMSCLLASGLVDFADPAASKVLGQILKADPASDLITEGVVQKEYEAFLEWITHSASCHTTECPKPVEFCSGEYTEPPPNDGPTPLGSCSVEDAVNAFTTYVMKWKGRCHGCHTNCEKDFEAPCWLVYDFDSEDSTETYNASLISMFNLIGIGAVDVVEPYQSTMLLKPLKLAYGGLPHGGGDKFADLGDETYQDYVLWLDYYKNCYDNTKPTKPLVTLFKPNKYEKKYPAGTPTSLHGFAEDPLEGVLSGESLVWTTDALPAPIAKGTGPVDVTLPVGKQIITLTATNSKGLAGTRAFKVYVKE